MKKKDSGLFRTMMENKERRTRVLLVLSLVVVLGTVAGLMLPASTLERVPTCGLKEHSHDQSCYLCCGKQETPLELEGTPEMACPFAAHVHSNGCYAGNELACGYSEEVFHAHTDLCYGEGHALICQLEERPVHRHTEECYTDTLVCGQEEGHAHDNACFEDRIVCGRDGVPGHVHTKECTERVQLCPLEENHVHSEACHARRLTCGYPEKLDHVHTAVCFDETGHAVCGQIQFLSHEHDEGCFANILSGHVHTQKCLSTVPVCGKPAHVHTDACYQEAPKGTETASVLEGEGIKIEAVQGTQLPQALPVRREIEDREAVWSQLQGLLQAPVLKKSLKKAAPAQEGFAAADTVSDYAAFDISLAEEAALNGPVKVTVDGLEIDLKALVPETARMTGVHYTLYHIHDGEVFCPDVKVEAEEGIVRGFSFETDRFSTFVFTYTVDFAYEKDGQTYTCSIPGGSAVRLSDLLESLNVTYPADQGETLLSGSSLAEFIQTAAFSDERLARVVCPDRDTTVGQISEEMGLQRELSAAIGEEKARHLCEEPIQKGEWVFLSFKPFETAETLTLELKDGGRIVISVTDASEVAGRDGIKSLLTDVSITGAKNEGGKYVFYPDQPYGIHLAFKEVNKENGQFPMGDSFTYQLPAGLVPSGSSLSNFLEIELSGGEHAGEKVKLNYTITDSGLITFTWDKMGNPAAYAQLADALYSRFTLDIECTYTGDSGKLDFGNGIEKEVIVRNNGTVTVNKKGTYNAETNCIDYTVSVSSNGVTKDVVITDTVSGTALTYKKDASASSSLGNPVPEPVSSDTGFTLNLGQMADNETVTVTYSAAVDLTKVTQIGEGSYGTVSETGNKAVVKSKDNPDVEKENSGKDFEHKISMSDIAKSGTNLEADENGHAKIQWTIRANQYANVSMAGHTIQDRIDGASVPMTYDGTGIHVAAYAENGTLAYDKDISWGQEGLSKAEDGKSWQWRVPDQGPDRQNLSYVITYTTDADVHDRLIKTEVKNTAEIDNGGTATGTSEVTPHGGGLTARKKAVRTDVTNKTITWEVSFDVPAAGLDSARIVDTVPKFYVGNDIRYVDNYLEGTLSITPELEGDESCEVLVSQAESGEETVTIEFFKLVSDQKVPGLSGTGNARRIRVQFQTEIDAEWLQKIQDEASNYDLKRHTNTGRVILNGQTIGVSATAVVEGNEPGMTKVHGAQTTYIVNGNSLPAFPYVVTLSGLSEEYFDDSGMLYLEDTFNSKYLAYYPQSQNNSTGDNDKVGYLYGAESYQDLSKGGNPINNVKGHSEARVVSSAGEGRIQISISREDIPLRENGDFYPYYYIYYYLTVKDPIALEKLKDAIQTSQSGTYELLNTVTNNKFGSTSSTAEFSIDVLDKENVGDPYYSNGNWMADFKIVVNPDALQLGDEEELELTDDYTNLAVDYTTIKIDPSEGTRWNRKGNRVTYTLQNGKKYVITYSARISGTPEGDGKVHFSNTAEYFGVKKWANGSQNISGSGSGESPTYGITVFKHVKGNGSLPLQGAKFKLYKYTEYEDSSEGWEHQPGNAINTQTREPLDPKWKDTERELTTDENGVAKTTAGGTLQSQTWYMLVETQAPVYEGSEYYKLKNNGYLFWITVSGAADYGHYVYLNDDVVAINNEPPIPETVDIGVTKKWTNDNGDVSKRKDVTVRLYADGVPYADWTDKNGDHLAERQDTVKVLPLKADGTTDGYTWHKLPGGPVYSVVEDGVAGYTTTYAPHETQMSGTIAVKNKYIPGKTYLHVEKEWSENLAPEARAEDITVQLKRKVSANTEIRIVRNNGELITHFSVPVGSDVVIGYDGKQRIVHEHYIESADRPGSELYKGNSIQASDLIESTESKNNGLTYEEDHKVRYSVAAIGSDGLTLRFPEDHGQTAGAYDPNLQSRFTNDPFVNETGGNGGTYIEDINFNNEKHLYTISAANGWKIDIDRLVKEDADGKYIYYIEEVGVNDNTETPQEAGYKVTYENNEGIAGGTGKEDEDTIRVKNAPETVDVDFTKKWINATAESGEVNSIGDLRAVIQLERWYLDESGAEKKDAGFEESATLYGNSTTSAGDPRNPANFRETTEAGNSGNWSAKFTGLLKKGKVNGQTVDYIYKVVEKKVYLGSDSGHTDLLKLGVFSSHNETDTRIVNIFPVKKIEVEKKWENEQHQPITPETGVKVTVQLQRRSRAAGSSGADAEWSEYSNAEGQTITLQGNSWSDSFDGLPLYGLQKESDAVSYLEYEYRVAETGVTIDRKPVEKHYSTAVSVFGESRADQKVTITNTETEEKFGDLELKKFVNGRQEADPNQSFEFTIALTAPAGKTLDESYRYSIGQTENTLTLTRTDGNTKATATVSLKAGEICTIKDLPERTEYEIQEKDYTSLGYSWAITEGTASGKIAAGGEQKQSVTFTNTYGGVTFSGSKSIVNRQFKEGDALQVTVKAENGGPVPVPSTIPVQITPEKYAADFSFNPVLYTFDNIKEATPDENGRYSKTFVYTVTETAQMEGTTTDGLVHTIEVTVSGKEGEPLDISEPVYKEAADSDSDGDVFPELLFVNTYDTKTEVEISGRKILTYVQEGEATPAEAVPEKEKYTFIMTGTPLKYINEEEEEEEYPAPHSGVSAKNIGSEFTLKIDFSLADYQVFEKLEEENRNYTYTYTVAEDQTEVDPVTHIKDHAIYDQTKYTVTVKLEYDEESGKLTATPAVEGNQDLVFKNTPLRDITVKKTWGENGKWPDASACVEMTLKADGKAPSLPEYHGKQQEASLWLGKENSETGVTWYNLPVFDDQTGKKIAYTVEETGMKINDVSIANFREYYTLTPDMPATPSEASKAEVVIDNTPKETEIQVTKEWTNNGISRTDKKHAFFKVHQVVGTMDKVLEKVWRSRNDEDPFFEVSELYVPYKDTDGIWETVTISKLPKYVWTGSEFVEAGYYVEEVNITDGTQVSYLKEGGTEGEAKDQAAASGKITIINRDSSVDIEVIKIDETTRTSPTPKKLKEAKFRLSRKSIPKDGSTASYTVYPDADRCELETNEQGQITFKNLPDGAYRIEETKSPKGYTLASKLEIYFTLTSGIASWTDEQGTVMSEQPLVSYQPSQAANADPDSGAEITPASPACFTVGNTPGASLPSTGAAGTHPIYTAGLALVLFSLLGLTLQSKKKQ